MASNRLSYLAISAFSLFLVGCPTPVDNQEGMTGGSGGSSSGGSSGRGGSGGGGSTGGSSSSGGSSGSGGSGSGGSGSGGSGSGGSSAGGSGGSGSGGSGSGGSGSGGSTGGSSGGSGGSGSGGMGGSGSGGSGGGMTDARMEAPAATGNNLPPAIATIFMTRCGTCHNNEYRMAASAFTRLKGMAGAPCSRPRMIPGMGAMSLVVQSMKGMKPCGTNMRMPPMGTAVPAAEIMTVETWINDGAKGVP